MNDDEWWRIEKDSSIYNALNGITGLCCYDGRGFMQLIEGPEDKAENLLERIRHDHCHQDLDVSYDGQVAFASYGEWAMRCCRLRTDTDEHRFDDLENLLAPSLNPDLKALMRAWRSA